MKKLTTDGVRSLMNEFEGLVESLSNESWLDYSVSTSTLYQHNSIEKNMSYTFKVGLRNFSFNFVGIKNKESGTFTWSIISLPAFSFDFIYQAHFEEFMEKLNCYI